jgi:capsular polysaccharide export protein
VNAHLTASFDTAEYSARTAGIGAFVGIAKWKQQSIRAFFAGSPDAPFCASMASAMRHIVKNKAPRAIAVWPSRTSAAAIEQLPADVAVYRIEDGFIRSAGLGANLVQPCSVAFDKSGIYYNPACPSDLETILQGHDFSDALEERAEALIGKIRSAGITKYNLCAPPPALPADRKIVLIAGQVIDDQSMLLGGNDVSITDLVRSARATNPLAFIIYKPHPDVIAGLRAGGEEFGVIGQLVDLILDEADTSLLLEAADEVHVITSLIGFEALLRECKVVTYGVPFYAGWGLTEDRAAVQRRGRPLTLTQLVAGTLILYPLYLDPVTRRPCSPETLIWRLSENERSHTNWLQAKAALAIAALTGKNRSPLKKRLGE